MLERNVPNVVVCPTLVREWKIGWFISRKLLERSIILSYIILGNLPARAGGGAKTGSGSRENSEPMRRPHDLRTRMQLREKLVFYKCFWTLLERTLGILQLPQL